MAIKSKGSGNFIDATEVLNGEASMKVVRQLLVAANNTGNAHKVTIKKFVRSRSREEQNTWEKLLRDGLCIPTGNDYDYTRSQVKWKTHPRTVMKICVGPDQYVEKEVPKSWADMDFEEGLMAIRELENLLMQLSEGALGDLGVGVPDWYYDVKDKYEK